MTGVEPVQALIHRTLELEAEKAELVARVTVLNAELASEAIRNEDLRDSLDPGAGSGEPCWNRQPGETPA